MGQVSITDVTYIVDENLLSLGNAMVAARHDTARFSRPPVEELLPRGIADTEWIPIVGDRGWVMITKDRRLRTVAGVGGLRRTGGSRGRAGSTTFIRTDWRAPVARDRGAEANDGHNCDHLIRYFHHWTFLGKTER